MEDQIFNSQYALDTFYFLICGALVMWMAAGFAMLEAGLVRAKNTAEILTKNVALFAIACIMYMSVGYGIMYPAAATASSVEITGRSCSVAASERRRAGHLRRDLLLRRTSSSRSCSSPPPCPSSPAPWPSA
jgi:Amt family ammonium transporter